MSTSGKFSKVLAEETSSDGVSQLTDFLAADFQLARADSLVHVTLCCDTTAVYALVGSDGAVLHLNGGSTIASGSIHYETFLLDATRTWNVQMLSTGTATLRLLKIVELSLV